MIRTKTAQMEEECLMRPKKFALSKTIEGLKGERSMHILLNAES